MAKTKKEIRDTQENNKQKGPASSHEHTWGAKLNGRIYSGRLWPISEVSIYTGKFIHIQTGVMHMLESIFRVHSEYKSSVCNSHPGVLRYFLNRIITDRSFRCT